MAVVGMTGFEGRGVSIDQTGLNIISLSGTASYSTSQARTGAASVRCNPASGASGSISLNSIANTHYLHFGIRVASLPSIDRRFAGDIAAGTINARLTSTGTIGVYLNTTLIGTSSALSVDTWYWIGLRYVTGTSVAFLQINGVDAVTGTATVTSANNNLGFGGAEASAVDAYFDDVIIDGAGLLQPSKVDTLLPISNSAVGSGWVGGAGGAASFTAVDNTPPVGVADTGTDTSQVRNATAAANSNYDLNLETYSTAGIGAGDTVLAVMPVVSTAAPVVTSAKQGTIGVSSNPVIAQVALGAGGTAGAFWSGTAGGTWPTGWKASLGTLTTSPSVTVGSSPVIRIRQVTSSTRIAMVCFLGLVVAWTPAAAVDRVPYYQPMKQLLAH